MRFIFRQFRSWPRRSARGVRFHRRTKCRRALFLPGVDRLTVLGVGLAVALGGLAGCGETGGFFTVLNAEQQLVYKDYRKARELAKVALSRDDINPRALMAFGWSEFKLGNYRSALTAFQKAESIENDDSEYPPKAGIAWSHFKLGNLKAAEAWFLKAKAKPRHYFEVWDIKDGLGWIAYARGELDSAQKYFSWRPHMCQETFWDVCGGFDWGWQKDSLVGRGLIAANRNQLAKAREIFSEGIAKDPDYFRNYDGVARTAFLEGRDEEALKHALEAAERVEYDEGLAYLIDAILQKIGVPNRSVQVFSNLANRSERPTGYHAFLGRTQLRIGRLQEAEASFVKALELNPSDDWVKSDLAQVRRRLNQPVTDGWRRYFDGDYEGALAIFQAKLRLTRQDGNAAADTGRAWALLSLGRIPDARDAFQEALKIDSNFDSAKEGMEATTAPHLILYAQGWALAEAGKFSRARAQFERTKTHAPDDFMWKAHDGLAWVSLYQKDTDKAEAAFQRILDEYPGAYLSRKGLGYVTLKRDDYLAAAEHLLASFSQEQDQILASYTFPTLGFLKARQFALALKILEIGDKAHPNSADIQFLLAKAHKGLNNLQLAAASAIQSAIRAPVYINPVFEELALDPGAVKDAYLALAEGLYLSGDNIGAIRRVEKYISAGGNDPRAHRLRGFALFREKRYKEAIPDLVRSAELEPNDLRPVSEVIPIPGASYPWKIDYDARSTLAWTYYRLGNAREAAVWFRRVAKTNPTWIDTLTGLGYSLLSLGDKEGALRNFQKAILVSPGYPDAWNGLGLVRGSG